MNELAIRLDQGGRRSGKDRRQFEYSGHIPERRSGRERRSGVDRRSGKDRRLQTRSCVTDMATFRDNRWGEDRRRLPPPYLMNGSSATVKSV